MFNNSLINIKQYFFSTFAYIASLTIEGQSMCNLVEESKIPISNKLTRVFFIEDSEYHWLLIQKALQECIPNVLPICAFTSEHALKQLNTWEIESWDLPKLIFLDLHLPQLEDGWFLLKQLKAMSSSIATIPVIVFSFSTSIDVIKQAYQMGVSSYIVKPIDYKEWFDCFNQIRKYWWETVTLPPLQF